MRRMPCAASRAEIIRTSSGSNRLFISFRTDTSPLSNPKLTSTQPALAIASTKVSGTVSGVEDAAPRDSQPPCSNGIAHGSAYDNGRLKVLSTK